MLRMGIDVLGNLFQLHYIFFSVYLLASCLFICWLLVCLSGVFLSVYLGFSCLFIWGFLVCLSVGFLSVYLLASCLFIWGFLVCLSRISPYYAGFSSLIIRGFFSLYLFILLLYLTGGFILCFSWAFSSAYLGFSCLLNWVLLVCLPGIFFWEGLICLPGVLSCVYLEHSSVLC